MKETRKDFIWFLIKLIIILPALQSFISFISFFIIYFSLTTPILIQYRSDIGFNFGLVFATIGSCIIQLYILYKLFFIKKTK